MKTRTVCFLFIVAGAMIMAAAPKQESRRLVLSPEQRLDVAAVPLQNDSLRLDFTVAVPAFQDSLVASPAPLTTTSNGESASSASPTAVLSTELSERLALLRDRLRPSDRPWRDMSAPLGRGAEEGRTLCALDLSTVGRGVPRPRLRRAVSGR